MQVDQKKEYFGLPHQEISEESKQENTDLLKVNYEKMRKKFTNFGKKTVKEFPNMQISFLTRAKGMEVCFGDVAKEEENIAASILRSIMALNMDLRILVSQNIILSGGSCMVPGFKLRLKQEMEYLIDHYSEFKDLAQIKQYIEIAESTFPPNCMNWIGASIVSSLNTEIDRFLITEQEFLDNDEKMPDRYGDAYIFAQREENYLNPDFEYKNQFAKNSIFGAPTPMSARSHYEAKKNNINNTLKAQLE